MGLSGGSRTRDVWLSEVQVGLTGYMRLAAPADALGLLARGAQLKLQGQLLRRLLRCQPLQLCLLQVQQLGHLHKTPPVIRCMPYATHAAPRPDDLL